MEKLVQIFALQGAVDSIYYKSAVIRRGSCGAAGPLGRIGKVNA